MNSKRRPLGATFKKVEDKGMLQRLRPSSARSSASGRQSLSGSFRSEVSNDLDLSVTGTKTAQSSSTPRQRQSLNLSSEKRPASSSKPSPSNIVLSTNKLKANQLLEDMVSKHTQLAEPKKNNFYGAGNSVETLEAEKVDQWWKNIPGDITFSPSSSLSFTSSKSAKQRLKNKTGSNLGKDETFSNNDANKLSSSIRNPSLNDFLDFSENLKPVSFDNSSLEAREILRKSEKNCWNFKETAKKSEQDLKTVEDSLAKTRESRRMAELQSQKDDEVSGLFEENSRKAEINAWKAELNSWKDEHSFDNVDVKYKAKDFKSNSADDEWLLPKMPVVNDVEKMPRAKDRNDGAEENAALTIQKWYRGYKTRLDMGHSAVQKMLEEKRALREKHMKEEERDDSSGERQRRREEKARLARQAAIQELNEKRERKKEENKQMAEQELKFLEESGKITKAKNKVPKQKKPSKRKPNSNVATCSIKSVESTRLSRPGTANTLDSKVEELFQETRTSTVQAGSQRIENESVSEVSTSRSEKTVKNSVSGSKSTLDDLFESLRQLEEQPADVKKEQKASVYEWLKPSNTKEDYDSSSSGVKITEDATKQSGSSTLLSQEKLRTIMLYLDEVEQTDQDTVVSRVRDPKSVGEVSLSASLTVPRVDAEKEFALLESASAAASDVTNAMMSVKVELQEKKKTNELLQKALNQQREFSLRQARDMEKDAKQRLELQRQEYESTIQRHLSFIDQLIDDKKILSERCEELVKKLKETDKKYVDKITKMEESHSAEMKKQKDVMQTAEKLRREKWVKEKSQQIKELTVKGLEPDIQKLIAKHKAELKKLKSAHQGELLEADERAGRRYLHQIEELRDQLEREKETACNRERELAQNRFQKQMEEEEQAFQQQRRRLYAEIQEEKERLATQAQKQRKELDELRGKLEETHKATVENVESASKRSLDELEQKHQMELKELKERLEIEKQQWIENYMKKQDAALLQKERELKESVRESRDKEIELVIRRLEDETALARDECERAAENRIKRVRDKYESEMKELERSEKSMHEKYTSMKDHSNELEDEVARLKASLKNEERKLEDLKKLTEQLQSERGQVVDIIRQEFADRLVTTDEDNKRLKIEMSELRAKHRLEVERVTNLKEEEMEEVHKRVKQAISKKEETLNALRQQKESAEKRADHLEFLLQEQRKKLLS